MTIQENVNEEEKEETNFPMSQRLENLNIGQNWTAMQENVEDEDCIHCKINFDPRHCNSKLLSYLFV